MTIAIYALSGDPITFGHIDIITRASNAFDKVIVGLGVNPTKKYLLTPEEREKVAKQSLLHLKNIEVKFFEGLLVDFAYEEGVSVIIRGIRNPTDAVQEQILDQINNSQMNLETMFMFSRSKLAHISSSNVKALQLENGLIYEYVPLPVKKIMERKLSHQLIYGITGVTGSGKSYIAEALVKHSIEQKKLYNTPLVYNIELDSLVHQIYTLDKPVYQDIRELIKKRFGTLDHKMILDITFNSENSQEHVKFLNDIFKEPLTVLLRKELKNKKGIILINTSLLVEGNLLNVCNNHVILVNNIRDKKLEINQSNNEKLDIINENIAKHKFGNLISYNNYEQKITEQIDNLYKTLIKEYNN